MARSRTAATLDSFATSTMAEEERVRRLVRKWADIVWIAFLRLIRGLIVLEGVE